MQVRGFDVEEAARFWAAFPWIPRTWGVAIKALPKSPGWTLENTEFNCTKFAMSRVKGYRFI
jgi:hypothetical protein